MRSILAEEFLSSREKYEQEAKKHTEETAATSRDDLEKVNEQWCYEKFWKRKTSKAGTFNKTNQYMSK